MLVLMLSISEMELVARATDASWRSPIADAAAARWGYPPGHARWWRSSSSHVFVLPAQDGVRSAECFLRLMPDNRHDFAQVAEIVRLMQDAAMSGVRVAAVEPSRRGGVVESVETDLGVMNAMVVRRAPGDTVDVDELTVAQARAWGDALGVLHDRVGTSTRSLPATYSALHDSTDHVRDDPDLAGTIGRIVDALDVVPRDPAWFGVGHGDFELDNLAWIDDAPTAFDFDDAGRTWFVGDIADAVRDLTFRGRPVESHRERFDAFVAGYRGRRDLPDAHVALLPLFAAAGVAARLVDLRQALIPDPAVGPESDSLAALRVRLTGVVERDRAELLSAQW
jgi:Ser/Thr protein kinase RdoA (MazF antagonist)